VKINGKRESPQKQLSIGDLVVFWKKLALQSPQPEKVRIHPSLLARVKILEANDDFWVIDKPYGVASQGGTKVKISLIEILEQMMESEQ
jgi:23S rRNA-/tRNA-specific pseudouridylate synthase